MRRVLWSRRASADFGDQVAFIAKNDAAAVRRIAELVLKAAVALGERPIGRPGRVAATYEKSMAPLPYILVYALDDAAPEARLLILRVIHTARDWPPGRWPA